MTEGLTLNALIERASTSTIEQLYDSLGYDYAKNANFDAAVDDGERERFLQAIAWREPPTSEVVARLFNQINVHYAERILLKSPRCNALALLDDLNSCLLFKQGKHIGIRERRIGYGYRVHLDFMDPFRRLKWLAGTAPADIRDLLQLWSNTADRCVPRRPNALALAMSLIAIHPFVDANGRSARLIYTWLCERWQLDCDKWLAEGSDGELLRTGHGVFGTEYLMARFMIALCDGANQIDPGFRGVTDDVRMSEGLRRSLLLIERENEVLDSFPEFASLQSHLESHGHFRTTSPRFECLRSWLY